MDGAARPIGDTASGRTGVTLTSDATAETTVSVGADPRPATQDLPDRLFALLNTAQHPYEAKAALLRVVSSPRSAAAKLAELHGLTPPQSLLSALTELLTAL